MTTFKKFWQGIPLQEKPALVTLAAISMAIFVFTLGINVGCLMAGF